MELLNTLLGFFQTGGKFMVPIALVLTLGLVIAAERWFYLSKAKIQNRAAFKKMQPMLADNQYQQLYDYVKSSSSHASRLVRSGMATMSVSRQREDILASMQEASMECVPHLMLVSKCGTDDGYWYRYQKNTWMLKIYEGECRAVID